MKERSSYIALLTIAWTLVLLAIHHYLLWPHAGPEDFFVLVFLALALALVSGPLVIWLKRIAGRLAGK